MAKNINKQNHIKEAINLVYKFWNKITNFSIAAIMNSQSRSRCAEAVEDEEDELEAKRRKLAEAVPALGESKINVIH